MKLHQDKLWLQQKYLIDKLSTIKIARLCKVSSTTIFRWMKKHGIKVRTMSEAKNIEDRPYKHKSWLYQIVINRYRTNLRQFKKRVGQTVSLADDIADDRHSHVCAARDRLNQAMACLSARDRWVYRADCLMMWLC